VLRAGVPAHAAEPERPTQQVPQAAAPPPYASDTQHLDGDLPSSRARAAAATPLCAPPTMLHGSLGMQMFTEMEDAAPLHPALPPVAEGELTDDFPSASVQLEIAAADATEAEHRARQSATLSQRMAMAGGGNAWPY
jgi:hypothetical protein